ncbi:MAG: metal-dependent transcriptional regulator [Anaerolineales bacterium]|nr:metal-dependent transcriptional regulator [Anaerolineales bacterium]MCB8950543.1 metal-dependent transcriptional regulator [Ardenticatenales bacterium]
MPDPGLSLLVFLALIGVSAILFWPRWGQFWRWQQMRRLTTRVLHEDALKHLYRYQQHQRLATVESVAGALQISGSAVTDLLGDMVAHQLVTMAGDTVHLTARGQQYALHIIRAHRLYERYLADQTGFAEPEWHDRAEQQEHYLTPADVDALALRLGNPTHDPHGDPIPSASGAFVPHGGVPLTSLDVDTPARIVHLEDEPDTVYAQLVAEDIHPGMEIRLLESTGQRVRFWCDGDEHLLAPIVAANISVVPLPRPSAVEGSVGERLSNLEPGESAIVLGLTPACRGNERRRFMDLGILPGTVIHAEMRSPSGDPIAFRIRDTLIALRREQADRIRITRESTGDDDQPSTANHQRTIMQETL